MSTLDEWAARHDRDRRSLADRFNADGTVRPLDVPFPEIVVDTAMPPGLILVRNT